MGRLLNPRFSTRMLVFYRAKNKGSTLSICFAGGVAHKISDAPFGLFSYVGLTPSFHITYGRPLPLQIARQGAVPLP